MTCAILRDPFQVPKFMKSFQLVAFCIVSGKRYYNTEDPPRAAASAAVGVVRLENPGTKEPMISLLPLQYLAKSQDV